MTATARSLIRCTKTLLAAGLPLFIGCQDNTDTPTDTGGGSAGVASVAGSSGSGGVVGTAGSVAMAGSSAGSVAAGASSGGSAGSAGTAGSAAGGSAGASGGGAGGAAGGTGGASGAAGSAGAAGAGGAACGTLDKANDGSYVRSGWTGVYTCTGDCPAKNGADTGDVATNAFDGNFTSRWSTGVFQSALKQQGRFPLFFTVDMQKAVPISKLTTHPGCKDIFDSPGTIEVQVSTDGTTFTTVTASPHTPAEPPNESCPPKAGAVATDTITFPTTCARYIRLKGTQRTTSDRYWAIGEMLVYP